MEMSKAHGEVVEKYFDLGSLPFSREPASAGEGAGGIAVNLRSIA